MPIWQRLLLVDKTTVTSPTIKIQIVKIAESGAVLAATCPTLKTSFASIEGGYQVRLASNEWVRIEDLHTAIEAFLRLPEEEIGWVLDFDVVLGQGLVSNAGSVIKFDFCDWVARDGTLPVKNQLVRIRIRRNHSWFGLVGRKHVIVSKL
jgi:hypothetical protein